MSSSKYANLPFIASGEKDIFETDDQTDNDQITIQNPIHDASIEIIPSGTNEAFQKFAFSDTKQSINNGKELEESFTTKINRLKGEIDELKSIVAKGGEVNDVASGIDELALKLTQLQEIRFQNHVTTAQSIIKNVDSVQKEDSNATLPLIKYELFCKPDKEQIFELSKLNFLDQRIKKIENIIGINETLNNNNFLNSYLKDQSIMNIIIQLSNKVVQFDHNSLEKIDSRLNSIIDKLNQISEKKASLDNLDASDKLSELYNYYVKTIQSRQTLTNVLEKLQVLNDVQEQACSFNSTLSNLKSIQKETKLSLEKSDQNLKSLKDLIETKSESIKQIINDFNQRLSKIEK